MSLALESYVQRRISEMESNDFALLSSVPSRGTQRILAAYRRLGVNDRILFRRAVAKRAAQWWGSFPKDDLESPEARLLDEVYRMAPFPEEIRRSGQPCAKAPELRRLAKLAFGKLLESQPEKSRAPGDWFYCGELLQESVSVRIRYGTRMAQIIYGLKIGEFGFSHSFNVEKLFGFGTGSWDSISAAGADAAFAGLKQLVLEGVREYKAMKLLL